MNLKLFFFTLMLTVGSIMPMDNPEKPKPKQQTEQESIAKLLERLKQLGFPADITEEDFELHSFTPLMRALVMGDELAAWDIIEKDPTAVKKANALGVTPLHCAAAFSSRAMVRLLLAKGANINAQCDLKRGDRKGPSTPAEFACYRRNDEVAGYLFSVGHSPSRAAFEIALARDNVATIYQILKYGGEIPGIATREIKNPTVRSMLFMFGLRSDSQSLSEPFSDDSLMRVAAFGNVNEMQQLLDGTHHSFSIFRRTLLNYPTIVPTFIQNFLRPHYAPGHLGEALAFAMCRNPEIEGLLIYQWAALADAEDILNAFAIRAGRHGNHQEGQRASQAAHMIRNAHHEFFLTLRRPMTAQESPRTYFQLLPEEIFGSVIDLHHGRRTLARSMRDRQNQMERKNIIAAVLKGDASEVERLLKLPRANPNIIDDDGNALLWIACLNRRRDIVGLLLDHGAYPNPTDRSGRSLFDSHLVFLMSQNHECITLLLGSWERLRATLSQRDINLDFGLRLCRAFLQSPDEAAAAIADLIRARPNPTADIERQVRLFYQSIVGNEQNWVSMIKISQQKEKALQLLLKKWPSILVMFLMPYDEQDIENVINRATVLLDENRHNSEFVDEILRVFSPEFSHLVSSMTQIRLKREILERWPSLRMEQEVILEEKKLDQDDRLVQAVMDVDLDNFAQALDLEADADERIDGVSLLEYIVLHHQWPSIPDLQMMIRFLLAHGADDNPEFLEDDKTDETSLFRRLLTARSYAHYLTERTELLLYLVKEFIETNGEEASETSGAVELYRRLEAILHEGPSRENEDVAQQTAALISAVRNADAVAAAQALDRGADVGTLIDDRSIIEYVVLMHPSSDYDRLRTLITILLERGADGNPSFNQRSLFDRLNGGDYRRYLTSRSPLLWHLLNHIERRGQQFPALRLRLHAMINSAGTMGALAFK